MNSLYSKLALGTANFGLNYGLANPSGRLSDAELEKIIKVSEGAGINLVDTAQAYGDSELRLGAVLKTDTQVITKIGEGLTKNYSTNSLCSLVEESMQRLKRTKLHGLLLHRPEILLGVHGTKILSELNHLKEKGLVNKVGISIYAPDILAKLTKFIDLDIVQAPFNLFDQRIASSGWAEQLKEKGTEIHIRSVFLQGLLLIKRQELPTWFKLNWPQLFNDWFELQNQTSVNADEIALNFALKQPWIDKVVIGVDNAQQLHRLIEIEKTKTYDFNNVLASKDVNLIDPSNWKIE